MRSLEIMSLSWVRGCFVGLWGWVWIVWGCAKRERYRESRCWTMGYICISFRSFNLSFSPPDHLSQYFVYFGPDPLQPIPSDPFRTFVSLKLYSRCDFSLLNLLFGIRVVFTRFRCEFAGNFSCLQSCSVMKVEHVDDDCLKDSCSTATRNASFSTSFKSCVKVVRFIQRLFGILVELVGGERAYCPESASWRASLMLRGTQGLSSNHTHK